MYDIHGNWGIYQIIFLYKVLPCAYKLNIYLIEEGKTTKTKIDYQSNVSLNIVSKYELPLHTSILFRYSNIK